MGYGAIAGVSGSSNVYGVKNLSYGQGYGNDQNQLYAERKDAQNNGQFSMNHSSNAAVDKNADMMNPTEQAEKANANKKVGEYECQTCKNRKYQDGSDDSGVSYQTPTKISPEQAASAVRGHEMEHVTRNQAKAEREDREVVFQTVTLHSAICPECGKPYISGGTTRTVTRPDSQEEMAKAAKDFTDKEKGIGLSLDVQG